MWYYVFPMAFFYAMFGLGRIIRSQRVALFIVGTLPAVLLVLLRGSVGTDTPMYLQSIDMLRDAGEPLELFEPLFERLILVTSRIPVDASVVLASFSLAITVLLFVGWLRIEPALILFTGVFSQFFFDMTMNGIRYGLAFSLVVVAATMLLQKQFYRYWLLIAAASLIQLSGGLLGVLLYILHENKWRALVYASLFAAGVLASFSDDLLLKLLANEALQSPGVLSGVAPLLTSTGLLLVWLLDRQVRTNARLKITLLLALTLSTYSVAQVTYAGLRLQQLVLFLISLCFACHLRGYHLRVSKASAGSIILVGVLCGILRLRNFADPGDEAEAPFIPYKFFWEP